MKIELLLNVSNYDFNSNSNPTDVENKLKDFCGEICGRKDTGISGRCAAFIP